MATTPDFAKVSQDIEALRGDVAKLAETLSGQADQVRQAARRGAARAGAAVDYALAGGSDFLEDAGERARTAADELSTLARRHPVAAVAAIVGVGLIAFLAASRR